MSLQQSAFAWTLARFRLPERYPTRWNKVGGGDGSGELTLRGRFAILRRNINFGAEKTCLILENQPLKTGANWRQKT
jgi:hypothetical protein